MKINEIELVGDQEYPIDRAKYYLSLSTPYGTLEELNINYYEEGNRRAIILSNDENDIAAIAVFEIWNNGKVWQARNVQTYIPYKGRTLGGKIYKLVKERMHKSIQSDTEQSYGGKTLWTKTLPNLGMHPMIFDTQTDKIIDPKISNIDMYAEYKPTDPTQWRYTWIIERSDHYPSQNLITEDSVIMPITGLWKK